MRKRHLRDAQRSNRKRKQEDEGAAEKRLMVEEDSRKRKAEGDPEALEQEEPPYFGCLEMQT